MWMDGGKWVGTMTDLIWDEDGEMFRLNPRTAVWTPPDPLRRSHRRVRRPVLLGNPKLERTVPALGACKLPRDSRHPDLLKMAAISTR